MERTDEAAPDRRISPFATGAVLAVAATVAVFHCVATLFASKYWFDEVYMLAIGRHHLDWGSADQPPVVPALAAAMDTIAPGSVTVLRLPAIAATAGAVILAGLIARELGADGRAQVLTAFVQATGLWVTLSGHWLTPYALEPAQWLLIIWLLMRWIRLRDDRLLLAIGVAVGIAALTKFQVLLLTAALLLSALTLGPRELLRRPSLWAGAGIAVLLAAPTLIWQHLHAWPQLQMTSVVAGEADALYGGRPEIAVQLLVFAGIAGTGLVLWGLWRMLRANEFRVYRFIAVAFLALFALFVVIPGRPYYLCGLYAPLAAAGAVSLQHRFAGKPIGRRWVIWPACVASVGLAVGTILMSVTITRSDVGEQIAARTAAAYGALPDDQRRRTAIFGQSYIVAAYLDGYSQRYGLPEAYSANRSYGYFRPPPVDCDAVLYIGRTDDELKPYFRDVRKVDDIGDEMHMYLLTGQRESWQRIWPLVRTLTVS
jgi:4-amino-4-deoxy-L-arabinose transferase-like glycosyltransferase